MNVSNSQKYVINCKPDRSDLERRWTGLCLIGCALAVIGLIVWVFA